MLIGGLINGATTFDIQSNDTKSNDTQHNRLHCVPKHDHTQLIALLCVYTLSFICCVVDLIFNVIIPNVIMLSVEAPQEKVNFSISVFFGSMR